jgi:hypothetical protein
MLENGDHFYLRSAGKAFPLEEWIYNIKSSQQRGLMTERVCIKKILHNAIWAIYAICAGSA